MKPVTSARVALGLLAAIAGPALPARAQPAANEKPSAEISLNSRGVAIGVGYSWGDGRLYYSHHSFPFSVKGISVLDLGTSQVSGQGTVYGLHRLADFAGTYVSATAEATAGTGTGVQYLRNSKGVVIRLDDTTKGARLNLAGNGVEITLTH
jgi:hypothetical protein